MIYERHYSWWRMLFSLRGTSLQKILPRILVIVLLSILVTLLWSYYEIDQAHSLTPMPFQLIGLAISIFLGFRNNVAYDRFWEGRKLWGSLVNTSRSFSRQVTMLIPRHKDVPDEERQQLQQELVQMTIGYVNALRHHLRSTDPTDDLEVRLSTDDRKTIQNQVNRPLFILRRMGEKLDAAWQRGLIDRYHIIKFEDTLDSFTNIQGGCERILGTPIPYAYTVLMHRIVAFYCFTLPFGLIATVGSLTPVVVALIAYAFLGLDDIGDEIEDPFGFDPNDLPLETICHNIEVNLLQHLDITTLPVAPEPINDILS